MKRPFLKAEWKNLIMANYVVDAGVLHPHLPYGTELDEYNGKTFVSLVGFLFANTKVLGMKIPYHINFEEVNLRFYVRHHDRGVIKRGVVFIKEIVPKHAITFIANTLYSEKYCTLPMTSSFKDGEELCVSYKWKNKNRWNVIETITGNVAEPIPDGSEEEFIAEHYYGYSKFNPRKTFEYTVEHPRWNLYPVKKYLIDCDFHELYGETFAFLKNVHPSSVFLARGSEIIVSGKRAL